MRTSNFRQRLLEGEALTGTFLRTPSPEILEILALSGLDFVCLDAEHAPYDLARLDACLAVACALDFPALVRVVAGDQAHILPALDSGAVGVVVPHVADVETARHIAKTAHFGKGGRGFNGGTRWAKYRTQNFTQILEQDARETVVIAQIEEPEGVDLANEIAAVPGIDALFIGPADLSVSYGKTDMNSIELRDAYARVGQATKAHGKGFVTAATDPVVAAKWHEHGVRVFVVGSEQDWIASSARDVVAGFAKLV